jgi:hypothetical protein
MESHEFLIRQLSHIWDHSQDPEFCCTSQSIILLFRRIGDGDAAAGISFITQNLFPKREDFGDGLKIHGCQPSAHTKPSKWSRESQLWNEIRIST